MNRIQFTPYLKEGCEVKILCPGEVDFFVGVGDKVSKGQPLYKIRKRELKESYFLPTVLGVKIENIRDYIGRVGGEYVVKGDLIAERLASGGLITKKVIAGVEGIVSTNRLDKGFLDIVGEYQDESVESIFDGFVKEIVLNSYIIFGVDVAAFPFIIARNIRSPHIDAIGGLTGELAILGDGDSVYNSKHLDRSYSDKIVFVGRYLRPELAVELYKKGAVALITYSIDYHDFKDLSVPIVVLAGFGQLRVNTELTDYLKSHKGYRVNIDSDNNELHFVNAEGLDLSKYKGNKYFAEELKEGDSVLIYEGERFATMGKVTSQIEEHLEDAGYVSITAQDGARTIVHSSSVAIVI